MSEPQLPRDVRRRLAIIRRAEEVHTHGVRVRERRGDVGFAPEPLPEYGVS